MVISRSITRNLRSTVFSLHRQELMAVTTLLPVYKQWGKSTGQTTNFPIEFPTAALKGFAQYNETGNTTGNADQTVTGLSKTSITTYRGYGYNYWVIGH